MDTVTIPKVQYQQLKRKASLYEVIFKFLPEKVFGIENYSSARIREFLNEDKVDTETKEIVKGILEN